MKIYSVVSFEDNTQFVNWQKRKNHNGSEEIISVKKVKNLFSSWVIHVVYTYEDNDV